MRLRQGTIASLVAELRGQCDDSAFVAVCVMARVSVWARSGCWRFFFLIVYTLPMPTPHVRHLIGMLYVTIVWLLWQHHLHIRLALLCVVLLLLFLIMVSITVRPSQPAELVCAS